MLACRMTTVCVSSPIAFRRAPVRRMGELLKQFDGRGDHMKKDGDVLSLTQTQIAERAGISKHQQVTAARVGTGVASERAVRATVAFHAEGPTVGLGTAGLPGGLLSGFPGALGRVSRRR